MRKIKVYYQHDSMQCGIACLQMICKFYGRSYSVEQLSHYCFATTEEVCLYLKLITLYLNQVSKLRHWESGTQSGFPCRAYSPDGCFLRVPP